MCSSGSCPMGAKSLALLDFTPGCELARHNGSCSSVLDYLCSFWSYFCVIGLQAGFMTMCGPAFVSYTQHMKPNNSPIYNLLCGSIGKYL